MRSLTIIFFSLTSVAVAVAQSITLDHQSINIGGGSAGQVDFSLGQFAISTLDAEGGFITQGFQQSEVSLETDIDELTVAFASVLPNPAHENSQLKVQFRSVTSGEVTLLASDGRLLSTTPFQATTELQCEVDLKMYPTGLYYLKVRSENGRSIFTEKVIKI